MQIAGPSPLALRPTPLALRPPARPTVAALWIVALALLAGCDTALQTSDRAVALQPIARDPHETGTDIDRWPGWRGIDGAGVAPGGSPPTQFGPDKGLRWKTAVPGSGNSSPVIWQDRALLTTALDKSDPPTLALLCFDRRQGKPLWQVEAGKAAGRTHAKNGYASASVATDGQRIFAFFGSTGLFAFDMAGKQLWRADLGDLDHIWGTAASPILYGRSVIQLCDCAKDSYIAAFDQATGQRLWKTSRPSTGCWSTPVVVSADAGGTRRPELIVNGTNGTGENFGLVIAYDPGDGRELWRVRGTTDLVTPTPLVCQGLVYSLSGRNGAIMAIQPGGNGDVTESRVVWKTARGGPYIPSGLIYRNRLYVLTDSGRLTCCDPGTGREIWAAKLRGVFTASPVAADGRIYAVSEQGRVFVVAAGETYQPLAENSLEAHCLATPAIAAGDLFVRTETELYCFAGKTDSPLPLRGRGAGGEGGREVEDSLHSKLPSPLTPLPRAGEGNRRSHDWPLFRGDAQATGVARDALPEKLAKLWTFTLDHDGFESTPAIVDGTVYIGSTSGKVCALNLADGKRKWQETYGVGYSSSPAVRGGIIYLGDTEGTFFAIDAASGKLRWKFATEQEINSSANFYKDRVLFGSQDGKLYCLDAVSGKLRWSFESRDQIRCFPTVLGNLGFVAGCDGQLHAVDLDRGTEVSAVDLDGPTGCAPAVLDGMVFVGGEGNTFFAIDPRKSKILWTYENKPHAAEYRSSAAVTAEAVVVGSRDKHIHAFEPKTGRVLWSFAAQHRVDSSPVIAGDRVFVGSYDGTIYGLDLKSGHEVWKFKAGGSITGSPAVAAGRLVIGTDAGDLFCFGAAPTEKQK